MKTLTKEAINIAFTVNLSNSYRVTPRKPIEVGKLRSWITYEHRIYNPC